MLRLHWWLIINLLYCVCCALLWYHISAMASKITGNSTLLNKNKNIKASLYKWDRHIKAYGITNHYRNISIHKKYLAVAMHRLTIVDSEKTMDMLQTSLKVVDGVRCFHVPHTAIMCLRHRGTTEASVMSTPESLNRADMGQRECDALEWNAQSWQEWVCRAE